ncbi:MAG: hypothetical protein IPI49_32395 [Myxococcales bacterium]|nr:hypothetical protein [Myxococcales bacterium]
MAKWVGNDREAYPGCPETDRKAIEHLSSDAEATPTIQIAMAQIDRLLTLVPNKIVTKSDAPENGRELHNWNTIAPAIVLSAANCLLSLRCLAQTGPPRREQDANILLRRLYEHVVCFAWLAIEPNVNCKQWVAYDYRYRLIADEEMQQEGELGLSSEERANFEAYRSANKDMPNLLIRAREADNYWREKLLASAPKTFSLMSTYTAIYRFSSADAHPSPQSLFAYVNPGSAAGRFIIGGVTQLTNNDRHAYPLAPLIFAFLLLVAGKVLDYLEMPTAADVLSAFSQDGPDS